MGVLKTLAVGLIGVAFGVGGTLAVQAATNQDDYRFPEARETRALKYAYEDCLEALGGFADIDPSATDRATCRREAGQRVLGEED